MSLTLLSILIALTLNVLYHTVAHELRRSERHNWKQFEHFCLISFFEKLEFVLHALSTKAL